MKSLRLLTVLAAMLPACNAVLGIGDYQDSVDDGGVGVLHPSDASISDGMADDGDTDGGADADPSCATTCGPSRTSDCCGSSVVPGGTYFRDVEAGANPATVSSFRLDTYEITVGRFRKFVDVYSQTMIVSGAGKNPSNASDPGWDSAWNKSLPANANALKVGFNCGYSTWLGGDDSRPMNCITWFEAEAFCTWDGGRLPTEAEWQYAATGGTDYRTYPWTPNTVPGANANLAVYGCYYNGGGTCGGVTNIAPVGSVSAGNGKWGQADMAGNVFEWVQDYVSAYPAACNNCAFLYRGDAGFVGENNRVLRGGSYFNDASYLPASFRVADPPSTRYDISGARCARPL